MDFEKLPRIGFTSNKDSDSSNCMVPILESKRILIYFSLS
jgi:hypothetical protein